MSAIAKRSKKVSKAKTGKRSKEIFYTICPVQVASHVAVEKGWLDEAFKKVGATARFLRALPKDQWLPHFTHRRPELFRDGGNIPPIWARSEGVDTKLIGLTFAGTGGKIVVKVGSGIRSIQDLRGKKIGLSLRRTKDRVDFARATAHRSILLALGYAGLSERDVQLVDIPEFEAKEGDPSWSVLSSAETPVEFWGKGKLKSVAWNDGKALLDGTVDAVFSGHGRSAKLESEGLVTTIEDLGRYPDWTTQVANTPTAITVNTELAKSHPEIVVAWLKASIKAGQWIRKNPEAAAEILAEVTIYGCFHHLVRDLATYNYVPNLSGKSLGGIEVEKNFLLEHGYIKNDFDVRAWADDSFLKQALK